MKQGGILPAIVGTLLLTLGTALVAVPIGVGGAVYLSEYARDTRLTRAIRLAIVNLAGIPSIVYGLFGLGMFVLFFRFGTSILAGSLTLAIMTLPVIISTAEEALRAVPQEFRTVSASLGGTRWQGIRTIVLPQALPGIITGRHPRSPARRRRDRADPLHGRRVLPARACRGLRWTRPWPCPTTCTSSARRCRACRCPSSTAPRWSCSASCCR